MRTLPPPGATLLLIDLQRAIDHPDWGERNNPDAEANVATLLGRWRRAGWPIHHVRHDSIEPASHYRPGQPGNDFKPEAAPFVGEPVTIKHSNSAFIGTRLAEELRRSGSSLVIAGVITNNSVDATVRMAGNLGFATWLVADACFTFARTDWNGVPRSAEDVHAMSLANLDGEYCVVVRTSELLAG